MQCLHIYNLVIYAFKITTQQTVRVPYSKFCLSTRFQLHTSRKVRELWEETGKRWLWDWLTCKHIVSLMQNVEYRDIEGVFGLTLWVVVTNLGRIQYYICQHSTQTSKFIFLMACICVECSHNSSKTFIVILLQIFRILRDENVLLRHVVR